MRKLAQSVSIEYVVVFAVILVLIFAAVAALTGAAADIEAAYNI
jgi:hypothetical protein